MDVEEISTLHERSSAWRLLRARNAPLILGFLGATYVDSPAGAIPATRLVGELEDYLYAANAALPDVDRYVGDPARYLEEWAKPEAGWLRRFYPEASEEVHYDATPALEKAYAWVIGLRVRNTVGTESRLHTLVALLRQIAFGADEDPETRLVELRRRRDEIDAEIAGVEAGEVVVMDGAAQRERYGYFASTARELLSDFRQVEENFRGLDRAARERIATWDGAKGELLESLVGDRTDIASSDEGRSFQAFYDFLLSQDRQDELTDLLSRVQSLSEIDADPRMRVVHHDWFDAAERTQQTVRQLSDQLRRFLDDQVWVENRRVLDLVRSIEANAIATRSTTPTVALQIEEPALRIDLPFERPLYDVRPASVVNSEIETAQVELDTSVLADQAFIDTHRLAENVRAVVPLGSSALLHDILDLYPLQDGLAELLGYLALTEEDLRVSLDDREIVRVSYLGADGSPRVVRMPRATVARQ